MLKKNIEVIENKTLKLTNVLIRNLAEDELGDYFTIVEMMDSYIRSKGATPIGPLIQRCLPIVQEDGNIKMEIKLLRQSNNFIHKLESPYRMESVIRVKNCMYARFIGEENKMKFVYDKINLYAYENDIPLNGMTYTVFVSNNIDELVADVFMEKENNEVQG